VPTLRATSPRVDDVRLGIAYMVASVFLFSFQNAIGKWLAQSYPIPMLVFFRSAVALAPCWLCGRAGSGYCAPTGSAPLSVERCAVGE
jgi:hypothetical protein